MTAFTYTNLMQLAFIIAFFWIDIPLGYGDSGTEFLKSLKMMFNDSYSALLLQGFILAYFIFLGLSIYVNSISTNYNMIVTIMTTPAVALFFTIFSSLNPGIEFSWVIVITSLVCSLASIILWFLGEKKDTQGYEELDP